MKKNLLLLSLLLCWGAAKVLAQGCLPKGIFNNLRIAPTSDGDVNKVALLRTTSGGLQGVNELFTSGEEVTEYIMEYNGTEYKLAFATQTSATFWIYHVTPAFLYPSGTYKITFYADSDADGISCNRDCDDNNASIVTTFATWYADADGDGYTGDVFVKSCSNPSNGSITYYQAGSAPNGSGDCNDNDATINPGKTEILHNGKDDDCNLATLDDPSPANSLHFDGTNDGVNCGNAASLQITGSLTMEARVKFDQFDTQVYQGNIINKESLTGDKGYALRVGGSGIVNFLLGNGTWIETNTDANTLQINKWYHLACTWDNVTKTAIIYIDGVPKKQASIPQLSGIGNNTVNLWLGAYTGTDRHPNVTMDEVRIWNIARTAKEIVNAMSCELEGTESGLMAYYKFNQGFNSANNSTFTSLTDATANGNNGTLVNFALTGATSNWTNASPVVTGTSCNTAPVLTTIGNKTVDEDNELSFIISANDIETPSSLSYSLDASSLAKGMSIDKTSGEFNWTPDNDQAGTHSVTITVTDGKLDNSEIFTISVNAVNDAPMLATISDQTVDEDKELSFTVTADDEETPSSLSYSLDASSLAKGMSIDAASGEFRWTPGNGQAGNHIVTITVSDGELNDSETFTITVNAVAGTVNTLSSAFSLYPNPASEQVMLQLLVPNSGIVRVSSLEGNVTTTIAFENTDTIIVDWEGAPGLYVVEIQTREGVVARQKMIRN